MSSTLTPGKQGHLPPPKFTSQPRSSYSQASPCSPGSRWPLLLLHLESWAIQFTTIREKEPGHNLKECANQGCKKKSHPFETLDFFFFSKYVNSHNALETVPENSQSLTSHLPSNTCSSAPHIFCQESTLLGLLPQPTEVCTWSCSENSHQQNPWRGKAQTWHLGEGLGQRAGNRMLAWSSDTRRKNS